MSASLPPRVNGIAEDLEGDETLREMSILEIKYEVSM
jgi:hypothetical protein